MLKTEMRNPKTTHIDRMSSEQIVRVIQDENKYAVQAIDTELAAISAAVDAIVRRMKEGGRLFYVGCGTSGRIGVLDASECPPTYGVADDLVIGIIAGGDHALRYAVEGAEDDEQQGRTDLDAYHLRPCDSVVGISAAGGAAYVLGALRLAKERGALTVSLTCNAACPIGECGRYRHPSGYGRRGGDWLDTHESRQRAQDDPKHDFHIRDDTNGICLRKSDGPFEAQQPEAEESYDRYRMRSHRAFPLPTRKRC